VSRSYLGFDLGASSGRAVLGELADGRLSMREVHRFRTPVVEADGHLFWDLSALWREITIGVAIAYTDARGLRSVSVDSWGVDYVSLDANDRTLGESYCYRDPRTRGLLPTVFARVPAAELYARTGIQMMEINTVVQVVAEVEQEPDLANRTHRRLLIADYLHYRMTGRAVAERTLASTSQLVNIDTGQWDAELMQRLGIPDDQWPQIVPPGTRLGPLRVSAVGGTDPGISVIAGCCHDTAAAVAAVPAEEDGPAWAYLSCGTWSLMGVERPQPIVTEASRAANFTNEAGLDDTTRFLKNLTGLWVLQECEREWREDGQTFTYAELMEEAKAAPSSGGFVDLDDPPFGERGRMNAKLHAYCSEHGIPVPGTRGAAVRLILESLVRSYARTLEILESLVGSRIEILHIVGGGVRNELLCQWTADACGRKVLAGPAEATVIGNLLVQARTLGDLPQGTSIRDVVRTSFEPAVYEPGRTAST
jgi:rhamnulokinase